MSVVDQDVLTTDQPTSRWGGLMAGKRSRTLVVGFVVFFLLSLTRALTDSPSLTSSQTVGTMLRVTIPILLAGLAALWAERCGVLNIGIEGLMIFGTWFGAWAAWEYGAWYGLAFGIAGGVAASLLHAMATVRFNVNHVISGTAINMLALGGMRYMSELVYTPDTGGGISQSPTQSSAIPRVDIPFLGGGDLFGWTTPDLFGWLEKQGWFLLSDAGGILGGITRNVSWASLIALTLVPITAFVLWRTRFGLRMRSSGEDPFAAESLGVKVVRYRYVGLMVSGGLAGFAGAFLSIVSASAYRQGQTGGRGFIGIATAIFGNWSPTGVLSGAALFGFAEALQLVGPSSLPNMFLFGFFITCLVLIVKAAQKEYVPVINALVASVLLMLLWLSVDKVPEPLTKAAPYILTLIVLSFASQRLRPPAMAGAPYRPGESH
jgi:general nucleoside transport system permease protein